MKEELGRLGAAGQGPSAREEQELHSCCFRMAKAKQRDILTLTYPNVTERWLGGNNNFKNCSSAFAMLMQAALRTT